MTIKCSTESIKPGRIIKNAAGMSILKIINIYHSQSGKLVTDYLCLTCAHIVYGRQLWHVVAGHVQKCLRCRQRANRLKRI